MVTETLVTENGSQFMSHSFKQFSKVHEIIHLHSLSYHLQSDAQVKDFMGNFKRVFFEEVAGRCDAMSSNYLVPNVF